MEIDVFTTNDLVKLNKLAVKREKNRAINDEGIALLDPNGYHVVDDKFLHNDIEWRVEFLCKMKGSDQPEHMIVDVDFKDYDNLKRTFVLDD